MHGVGEVGRAESTSCAIIHVTGSRNYSTLVWDWASVWLGLPENRRRYKDLQDHSSRSSLFAEKALEHGASQEEIPVAGASLNNSLRVTLS